MSESIFILEDELLLVWSIKERLQKLGFKVDNASTLKEGLEKVSKNTYKLYIIDIFLPDGSGFAIIEHIKKKGEKGKIIIITAYGDLESITQKAIKYGVTTILKKPFNLEEIYKEIKSLNYSE